MAHGRTVSQVWCFALLSVALVALGCQQAPSADGPAFAPSLRASTAASVSFRGGTNGYAGTRDTVLSEYAPTTNYGSPATLTVDGSDSHGKQQVALIRWDLSSIPANATVTAATLTFWISDSSTSVYPIYALNRDFDEASATWRLASTGVSWATAGAGASSDRSSASVGSLSATATGSRSVTLNSTGIAVVNGWVATPATNRGFIIASTTNKDAIVFASSESSTVSYRPMITLAYTVPESGTGGTSGTGGIVGTGGLVGTGGDPGTGGVVGTGGLIGAGGVGVDAGLDGGTVDSATATGGTADGNGFGFFVFSDSHVGAATNSFFSAGLAQMQTIAAAAGVPTVAAVSLGDHTMTGSSSEWSYHMALARPYLDPAATAFGGSLPRYLAAMGNHDVMDGAWYSLSNANFAGQKLLGVNSSTGGVYFSFSYGDALFVVRDTNTATNAATPNAQVTDLQAVLAQSDRTFKFVFEHKPAYYCGQGGMGQNPASLALLDAAVAKNVDIVFNGHSHVYARTCRMTTNHACTGNATGTVQLEVGTIGSSTTRTLNTAAQTLSAYDASGTARSYGYTCSTSKGYDKLLGGSRSFVYVKIVGCAATFSAYQVGSASPFDTWTVSHCP